MIRKQMKEMGEPKDYLADKLPEPKTPALDSDWFKAEIARVVAAKNGQSAEDETMIDESISYGTVPIPSD